MFEDLNSPEVNKTIDADICIVGAGAAGISLAMEFLETNVSIVLLESGDFNFDAKTQALNEGEVSGLHYLQLDTTRLRYFGGTTNHWAGQCTPFNLIDFQKREWVANSGWPILYKDYFSYLDRAKKICIIGQNSFAWEEWRDLVDFPLDENIFSPVMLRFPDPVTRFGQVYRDKIKNAPNVHCILNANATNIEVNDQNIVEHIDIKSLKGKASKVRAKKFILACGALQNIKLLLNSRNKYKEGIGNKNGLVGKYFMEHPWYDSGEVQLTGNSKYPMLSKPKKKLKGLEIRYDFQLTEHLQEKYKILNHTVFFIQKVQEPAGDGFAGKVAQFWEKTEAKVDEYFDSEPFSLRVRLEQAPYENSRVSLFNKKDALGLNEVNVHLEFSRLEGHTLRIVYDEFAKTLGAQNIGRLKVDFDPENNQWTKHVGWQWHHLGGTRMSDDPASGVVDVNCKVYGTNNLYISSSSIFPTGGQANPTMNLIAFAMRLADHIKKEMAV